MKPFPDGGEELGSHVLSLEIGMLAQSPSSIVCCFPVADSNSRFCSPILSSRFTFPASGRREACFEGVTKGRDPSLSLLQ